MHRHPIAKILALVATLKVIVRYATHKEPATLEEAKKMLRMIRYVAEEAITEEAASPTNVYAG